MPGPIPFDWDGERFTPKNQYWAARADERFVVGETYTLDEWQGRSQRSHAHYFASIKDAWLNLPEDQTERFATEEHLRKYALIKAGFHDERTIVASSKAEAQRLAAFVRPMDEYAIVVVREAVVIVYTAKSQSTRAMGAKTFQQSKQAVLDILADMVGVAPKTLAKEAGQAA